MSWLAVKVSLSKAWVWLKEYWQIPFLAVWTLVVYLLTRRSTEALIETIEIKRDSYKQQLESLEDSHKDELLKRNQLSDAYLSTLERIEREFSKEEEELSKEQKKEIKNVVIESRGDPSKIREKIEREFGFKYVE